MREVIRPNKQGNAFNIFRIFYKADNDKKHKEGIPMTKENKIAMVSALLAVVLLLTGIYVGETKAAELERISRTERVLSELAEKLGCESLGVIDGYAISQRNGYVYDGPAIRTELFKRIGWSAPENYWAYSLTEVYGISIIKLQVYADNDTRPMAQREIVREYVYGVL